MALKHPVTFDSIKCDALQYVPSAECWVCMDFFYDLNDPEFCMTCKFGRMLEREEAIRKESKRNGNR